MKRETSIRLVEWGFILMACIVAYNMFGGLAEYIDNIVRTIFEWLM